MANNLTKTIVDQAVKPDAVEPVPSDMRAVLRVVEGPDEGETREIRNAMTLIGRGRHCDLVLHDDRVSARHASLSFVNGEFRLKDEESTNGTLLNGSTVKEFAIKDGDLIRVGRTVFILEIDFQDDTMGGDDS